MKQVTLGRTGIVSGKNAFGGLPIQRVSHEDSDRLLQKAFDGGVTFFDTARGYSDSEEKIGRALSGVRDRITIATKTFSQTVDGLRADLETSLSLLQTDCIDIFQFHNPGFCPKPGDGTGLYETLLEAREQGKIKYIGITNHSTIVAEEAVRSGLYDTLQFPFCYLAVQAELDLVNLCREHNVGFIAMKGMSGGLITNPAAAYAWLDQFDNVLPIWGIQREEELDDFLGFAAGPPALDETLLAVIEQDRKELAGNFCRGCGYCMPVCPAEIQIGTCARMSQLIRRSPSSRWLEEEGQAMMMQVESCTACGSCREKCPYGLDTPALLKQHLADYKEILAGRITV